MATTISIEVVRSEDGTVDVNGTLSNAENALMGLQMHEKLRCEAIGKYVHAVFDEHFGKKLPIPNLQANVVHKMVQDNVGESANIMANFKEWQEAVRTYVRTDNEFDVAKGKGGGAYRVCDVPPKKNGK